MPDKLTSLLIRNARLLDPATHTDQPADLLVSNGLVAALGNSLDAPGVETLDAAGHWLLPGLVDIGAPCVSVGKLAGELRAAAAGGVSHLATYSSDACIIDNRAQLQLLQDTADQAGASRLWPLAALTIGLEGEQLTGMEGLAGAGAIGFSNAQRPVRNSLSLKRCMEYAATFDLLVTFCPLDDDLAHGGCAHEGAVAARLGLPGIPASAETLALSRALLLAEETGVRIHIHQLSSAHSLPLLQAARARGVRVTADVSIHHLLADETAIADFDSNFHLLPPLRRAADRTALLEAVADGRIEAISSQHTPLRNGAKQQPFGASSAGIAGVETLLPLLLKLVETDQLPLLRALDAVTAAPARCMGLAAGSITEGTPASLCLVDANCQQRPADHWLSVGRNSPWREQLLPGKVCLTLSEGRRCWG